MTSITAGGFQDLLKQITESASPDQPGKISTSKKSFKEYINSQENRKDNTQTENQNVSNQNADLQKDLSEIQNDLTKKLETNPVSELSQQLVFPELLLENRRSTLFAEAMKPNNIPAGSFKESLASLENDWNKLESIISSNQSLSPGDLLALQAKLYQVSQHLDVMSKVLDQMVGGIKTVLNTNV